MAMRGASNRLAKVIGFPFLYICIRRPMPQYDMSDFVGEREATPAKHSLVIIINLVIQPECIVADLLACLLFYF